VALHEQHPLLDLEINAQREPISLNRHQSDIALRLGRPEKLELVARRVAGVAYHFYATPQWRDRIERGATPCFGRSCTGPSRGHVQGNVFEIIR
jgi:DNA-binding transcriptional LysR family regulator